MKSLTGYQIRDTLLREIGLQLEDFRLILHDSSMHFVNQYWEIKDFPQIPLNKIRQIVTDGMSSGQVGKIRVTNQLKKLNSILNFKDEQIQDTTKEIISILSDFSSKLNYARFRARCVTAHLDNLSDTFGVNKFQSIPETEKETFITTSKKLLGYEINSAQKLDDWIEKVHNLLISVSGSFDVLNEDGGSGLSSRAKKGFIAAKNIPTYKKHWTSFVKEIIYVLLNEKQNESGSINELIKDLEIILELNSNKLNKLIQEKLKSIKVEKRIDTDSNEKKDDSDSIDLEIPFYSGNLKVSFNKSGIDKSLIEPLLASLMLQSKLDVNKTNTNTLKAKIKNGQKHIELSVDKSSTQDLNQIRKVLELL